LTLVWPSSLRAQESADWRLSLSSLVFGVSGGARDFDDHREQLSSVAAGLGAHGAQLGVGYRVMQPFWLGLSAAAGYAESSRDGVSTTTVVYELLTRFEFLFSDGLLRPSLGGLVGLSGSDTSFSAGLGASSLGAYALSLGAVGELRFFVLEALSVDLGLQGLYSLGKGSSDTGQSQSGFALQTWQLSFYLGLSGYL
jgi:hypothetical protein